MIETRQRRKLFLATGISFLALLEARSAHSDVTAITFPTVGAYPPLTAEGFNYTQGDFQLGVQFAVATPITVTELGYYDSTLGGVPQPTGAFNPHTDTLIDVSTGTTLATATITASDPATGLFRFAALDTPVALTPGVTYLVQGDSNTNNYAVGVNVSAASISPAVLNSFSTGDIFGVPPPPGTLPDFGANFQFTLGAVTCKSNVPGKHVFAANKDFCVASGAYHPTATTGILPFTDHGFGLVAYGGGYIGASTAVSVQTTGATSSYAAWSQNAGSLINLTSAVTVTTSGTNSYGLYASDGGDITVPDSPSVTTTGGGSIGVYASGAGSSITAGGAAIATSGALAPGVQADGGGGVTLNGGTVATTGAGSVGLYATGAGSMIAATGVGVTTSGGVSTSGGGAIGAYAANGGELNLSTVTIATSGTAAYGVETASGSSAILSGGSVTTAGGNGLGVYSTGAGSNVSVTGTAILTKGMDANGVLASSGGVVTLNGGSVTTTGDGSPAIAAVLSGSSISATGTAITTQGNVDVSGAQSIAVWVAGAGASGTLTDDTIVTSGIQAHGVLATLGGAATVSGGSITVSGTDANGVMASGVGSTISASGGTTIISSATPSDFVIAGARAENSGTVNLTDTSVTTSGAGTPAVDAETGGAVNLLRTTLSTTADDAHAVVANGSGSQATLSGANILNTSGNGSIGLYATNGGLINATGQTTISTLGTNSASTGLSAFGVNADGSGSQINLAATTITTSGEGAVGLYASDVSDTGHGGAITASGQTTVTTGTGSFSYGAWAQSPGSTIALNGPSTFTINGSAFALYATQGGSISSANTLGVAINGAVAGGVEVNDAGSTATLTGTTNIALNGTQNAGFLAATGGAISAQGPTTINVFGANSVGVEAFSGSVTASGPLNVTTSLPSSPAFTLSGTSPSIVASGGGVVSSAGNAINLDGATNAVATFDNFSIANTSGDLIFADPSTGTVNFNNTVADAGTGNLLNATAGSVIALNASASTLTGAIATDATSTTNVSLSNGSTWNMTGSSTATSLNVANSAIVFSPPSAGGFKTLTVGSYVGMGAGITLNTVLGGTGSASDQLIVSGGSATGLTSLTIRNVGGAGAQTTGAGIPVVVATNGGTTSANAFQLANTPVVGGFRYTLDRDPGTQDWSLTSTPASTLADIQNSVTALADSRQAQMITGRLLSSLLLGANEQVNCSSCAGGFASIGSFALGSHGRWSLSDRLTLLAGASYDQYTADGVTVTGAPIIAASLRYDFVDWGNSRPFFEFGGAVSPYMSVNYGRSYADGFTQSSGTGSSVDRQLTLFGRAGWVFRLTPIDETAAFVDLARGWQQVGGYSEAVSVANPFAATVSSGVDTQDVTRIGAQYTHLIAGRIEANVNAALAYGFDNKFGSQVTIVDFGGVAPYPLLNSAWAEFGGRLAYRVSQNLVADAFLLGTIGGEVGRTLHAGLGVRYAF